MMKLGHVARQFFTGFRGWDARSKSAFALAAVLLTLIVLIGRHLPEENRSFVIIGVVGLMVTMQGIFLYANRGMVTTVTKAQRLILNGHYKEACQILEKSIESKPDLMSLTLLGNAYRMLGRIEESRQTLTKAIQISSDQHFPLYSFGRTLLAGGYYAEAGDTFRRSLEKGAPGFAHVDLAEADFRAGHAVSIPSGPFDEAHVALMAGYLAWRTGQGQPPNSALIESGIGHWEKSALRFSHTRYGVDLERDLAILRGLPHPT